MSITQRCFLVTGASSGIGRAIAERLLNIGHQVLGSSRDCSKFLVPHPNFFPIPLDLNASDQIRPVMLSILKNHPQLDGVVFAAGIGQFGSLEEFSDAQIERLMNVNFTANVLLTKALLPAFKKKTTSDLIYIGSEAALKGSRKGTIYCASKFALRGFTQALREECASHKIRITLLNPGMVKTPFFDLLNFEPGPEPVHAINAQDLADTVQYLLESNPNIVIDEITLNPMQKVIHFKK